KFRYPRERIFNKEPPDFVAVRPIKIDGCTPGSAVSVGKVGPKIMEIISFRPEMVVNHIQNHRQATLMACVNQPFEPLRTSIRILHRERVNAIIAPIALPRE